jgi:hypothetical protein
LDSGGRGLGVGEDGAKIEWQGRRPPGNSENAVGLLAGRRREGPTEVKSCWVAGKDEWESPSGRGLHESRATA